MNSCKKQNELARSEYESIKAHITKIAQEVLRASYNSKAMWKLPPEIRLKVVNDIILKKLCKDFKIDKNTMQEWLMFDYLTEITKIDLQETKDEM